MDGLPCVRVPSQWTPILPPVVAASEPRATLAVDAAAQAILDAAVPSLTELHVLGTGAADDERVHVHPPTDVAQIVSEISGLDLLVLDERLVTADLVETLETAREHAMRERELPPVVVYRGTEDVQRADPQVLPGPALSVLDAWERAVLPGLGGVVVLVDPARLRSHPRLRYLLRHLQTPGYVQHRLLTGDFRRQTGEREVSSGADPAPTHAGAEAAAAREAERARQAIRSADELRAALTAAQEQLLEASRERDAASQEAAMLRARLSDTREAMDSIQARLTSGEAEQRRLQGETDALRSREQQLLANLRELEDLLVESNQAEARRERVVQHLEAVEASTAWRWGHRMARLLRRLTFRRAVGPSALDRAIALLREPAVRDSGRKDFNR
jgi:hypothetical protein